jgi:formylmethanofuran dehydrogenase subunit E
MLQNNDYELEPLFEETFHLEFQGYGKLVSILNKADKEGIIRLKSKRILTKKCIWTSYFKGRKKEIN